MRQTPTIQKFIQVVLLVVFTISIAPKDFFHQAFASHTDWEDYCSDDLESPRFHQSGIDCHFDELVVNSLYHFTIDPLSEVNFCFFNQPYPRVETSFLLQAFAFTDNRGPPSM